MEDTESILAKAIRDGGIEASIDHENKWMTCKDKVDVYATNEPQTAFHARVAFCLDIHNEASPFPVHLKMPYCSGRVAGAQQRCRIMQLPSQACAFDNG